MPIPKLLYSSWNASAKYAYAAVIMFIAHVCYNGIRGLKQLGGNLLRKNCKKMIGVLYIFCEARTFMLYGALRAKITELFPAVQNNIEFIMMDSEWAASSAKIKMCWFHFNQTVQRKWNNLSADKAHNIVLSMTMSISLRPKESVGDAFCVIQNYLEKLGPTDEKLIQFLSYIERTWLRKTAIVSVYGIPVRTNNAVESYNRIISRKLGSHPNIWVFLEKLEHLIMDQQIDLQRLYNGHKIQSTRLKKHIDRDRKIQAAQASFISGRLPLEQFFHMFFDICTEYQYRYCLDEQSNNALAWLIDLVPVIQYSVALIMMVYRLARMCQFTLTTCATRSTIGSTAVAVLKEDGTITVAKPHDHPPQEMELRVSALRQKMYSLCESSQDSMKNIFDNVSELDSEAAMHLSYATMKSCLYKRRARCQPGIPDKLSALHLVLTDHSLYKNIYKCSIKADDGSVAVLFSSDELLAAVNISTEIYVDGTFSIVPRMPRIAQLYSIHIRVQDTGIATMFVLCQSRTCSLYRAICSKIIELAPNAQQNVKLIMSDYERAALTAFREHFPNASMHGCWFHFNQAILRKWRNLKLKNAPKNLIAMAMSLPLLPDRFFNEGFAILQEHADDASDTYPEMLRFMCYMRKTWLPIAEQISVYKCPARTNNLVESFHNTARKVVGNRHPSFWIFIDKLRAIIKTQEIDLGRAHNNLQVRRPRSHMVCKRNTMIIKKQLDLVEGRISTAEFLSSFKSYVDQQAYFIDQVSEEDESGVDDLCASILSTSLANADNEP